MLALLALLACDPGYRMSGRVHAKGGRPIAGALAQTECPDGKPPLPGGTSDAQGKLDAAGVGGFREDCVVEVSAPGYAAVELPVSEICSERSRFYGCLAVELEVELVAAK